MPRPITQRQVIPFSPSLQEGAVPEVSTFWDRPEGTDLISPLNRLGPNRTPRSQNLSIGMEGRLQTRDGTVLVGDQSLTDIVGLITATNELGQDFYVRVTTVGVFVSTGGIWTQYSGPTLAMNAGSFVEFTSWAGDLLFTDRTVGLYAIDFNTQTYALIGAAPIGFHLTAFGGRVILSNIANAPTRVQWPVKNSSVDWSGIGSGFDDMLSAPGGIVDVQQGIFPITDTEAYVIRTSSIWVMGLTGNPDAPFQFNYRFNQGTDAPQSIVRLPNQELLMLGRDDVVKVTLGGVQDVAIPIRDELLGGTYKVEEAKAAYDSRKQVYLLYVPPVTATPNSSIVWRLHVPTGQWYRDVYPFEIRRMAVGDIQSTLSIAELTGTIGALAGTIGGLGLSGRRSGFIYAHEGQDVVADTSTGITDSSQASGYIPVPVSIWSGLVQPGGPLTRSTVLNFQVEYFSTRSVAAVLELSQDGGVTWTAYGTFTFVATTVPQVSVFRRTVETRQYQFRLVVADGVGLQIIAVHVTGQRGAPVNL